MTDLFDRPSVQGQPPRSSRAEQRERRAASRRRKQRRRTAVVVVVTLLVVGGAGYAVLTNVSSLFQADTPTVEAKDFPGPGGDPVDVTIEPGSTGVDMAEVLVDAGVVASTGAFVDAFGQNPQAEGIQPGTHTLLREMKASDAVARLAANDSKVETRLTIPEGYTAAQVAERAASVTGIAQADFDAALADPAAIGLPAEAGGDAEGWLFPATYVLGPDETAASILERMVAQTVQTLDGAGVAPEDRQRVLTIASLIEREAKFAPDRPRMAQAIQNRLDDGMPLQIDAAVAYGLGIPGTELTRDHTQDPENPYNTYVHQGLPPGPIASPGLASIEAVLNPEPGDWLFWVAVNLETGETRFAETYEEHLQNEAELRRWQEENGG